MKKSIIVPILILVMIFTSCNFEKKQEETTKDAVNNNNSFTIRATWITCFEMENMKNVSEEQYKVEADKTFKNISDLGFNNAFVQIRPFGDSFYPSSYFPWSEYVSGKQGKALSYDPLKILISSAHENNIKFHAWVNPYRVSLHNDFSKLSSDNPAVKYSNDAEKVYICDEGIYYNPTSVEMQKLILDGIKEIVSNYDVDGIHIDDYFYPTTEAKIDSIAYNRYVEAGGKSALAEWRVWNVNNLISGIYSTVKSVNKNLIVSISPSGDIERNLTRLYADAKEWMCNDGYCDWIVPQLYFGFENEYLPFQETLSAWLNLCKNPKCKIIVGLACYKCSAKDEYAGNGEDEWINDNTVLKRQIQILKAKNVYGYALFSYKYVLKNCNQL